MNNIIMNASNILISELKSNRRYMTLSMRMFSTRENLNHVAVTEAFIDSIIANKDEYVCMPLCADVPKMEKKDYRALTHLYDPRTNTFYADVIGGFYDFEKVSDEFGVSLIGHARVNKRNEAVCTAIEELYANNALNFSFEISAGNLREENGITIVDASDNNELTAMAVVSVPAYPESKALDLVAEATLTMEDFYKDVRFVAAEMDIDTVRRKFWDALNEYKKEEAWHMRPLLFCIDCVILYDEVCGKTFKAEYLMDGDELVLKDLYEVEFTRTQEGSEFEMKMNETNAFAEAEQVTAEAEQVVEVAEEVAAEEAEVVEAEAETAVETAEETTTETAEQVTETAEEIVLTEEDRDDPDDRDDREDRDDRDEDEIELAELRKERDELKAQLEELKAAKEELDKIKAEREQAELDQKKNELREYAIAEGLNVEDENVARAIDEMDHASLMSEVMKMKNSQKEANQQVAFVASFGISQKGTSYLLGHSKD